MVEQATRRLDPSLLIRQTSALIRQHFAVLATCAVLLVGVPSILAGYIAMTAPDDIRLNLWAGIPVGLGAMLLQASVMTVAANGLSDRPTPLPEALGAGLKIFWPMFALGFLSNAGIILGLVLLIIPGVFLSVIWMLSQPVLIAEGRSVSDSLRRSAELSKGNRWLFFGFVVAYFAAMFLPYLVFDPVNGPVIALVVFPLLAAVQELVGRALLAAAYYGVRGASEEVAIVFD